MKYKNVKEGKFIARLNRFIASVEIEGQEELCHVKNTGRLKELLLAGSRVFVDKTDKKERKTKYDLISIYKGQQLVNIDSQAPNKVAREYFPRIINNLDMIKAEARYKNSRFDFYLETSKEKFFVEVKGVTLEKDGIAMFPDAPTERGLKHLHELSLALEEGYKALVLFIIQMKGPHSFTANKETHEAFALKLKEVQAKGVEVLAIDCLVSPNKLKASQALKVLL